MSSRLSPVNQSRRDFLKFIAVAGVTATGGYALWEYEPWLNYDGHACDSRRLPEKNAMVPVQMRELIRYATLAANGHNTQPWKFVLREQLIEIHPDYSRRLSAVDPDDRELWISLGCALENFLIAARAGGYAPEVTYPDAQDFIRIKLASDVPQGGPLLDAIQLRQNTRSEFDGRSIRTGDLERLQTMTLEPGVTFRAVTTAADIETVLEYVNQGNLKQYADRFFLDELISWLRFTKKEALAFQDGLYSRCSGNPEVPRWFGRMVVAGTRPQQQADVDACRLRSSSGAVVIAAGTDDKAAWVRTGQVYERMALIMTSLNIKFAFLNQPIEVPGIRSQFRSAMGLGNFFPELLVRFGYANPMPLSLRRPVEQVLVSH